MKCQYIKEDGNQCGAMSMKEATFCFTHNPDSQEEKQLAVLKGGLAQKRVLLGLEPLEVKTPQQVVDLLENTINGVRSGEIPPNIANTLGYLAGHMLKAIEISNIDQRVELVESVLMQRKISMKGKR